MKKLGHHLRQGRGDPRKVSVLDWSPGRQVVRKRMLVKTIRSARITTARIGDMGATPNRGEGIFHGH
jgi:hypothetical protein